MKNRLGREISAWLVKKEIRVSSNPRFKNVSVILAESSTLAIDIAENQLGLKLKKWPTFRKDNDAHFYKLCPIPIVETDDPLGIRMLIQDGIQQLTNRR